MCAAKDNSLEVKGMTRDEQVQYWLDIADYDLDTAVAMHQTGR